MYVKLNDLPVEPEGMVQHRMLQVMMAGNQEWIMAQSKEHLKAWLAKAEEKIDHALDQIRDHEMQTRGLGRKLTMEDYYLIQQAQQAQQSMMMSEFAEAPETISSLSS
jgi:hypothetical protein|tara:strand:+ start:490 stop:813 length:324 start_codon:yes stop_codon:yes gene_type:complete